ncbi:class D sortase [Gracilibacillus oryzae]|uniref:Class D sortase n=1 Tax=Gracilibacillus oryzae TaxID=1672701 RepID=A0A7C8KRJ6_9BACI|nr:class D sortase [Gracilibacillus oryzae]KAB8126387.1 class D sortase [Gracilibacillus oryzae]
MKRRESGKSKKRKLIKWVLIGIPILFIVSGISVVAIFGWEMTKSTVHLSKTVVMPYKPENKQKVFKTDYWDTIPKPGESLGALNIESLDLSYPVVQGTREEELKEGIGHMMGTMLPGQGGHVILSGHRDTVFRELEHLEVGDEITFSTKYGDFIYEAVGFEIVSADDRSVAVPKDYETLTLTTCYPFDYIGDAPDRYIVYTELKSSP